MGGATALIGLLPTYTTAGMVRADHADLHPRAAGPGAGRRVRRRGGLRRGARAGQQARLLHQLHSDHRHAGPVRFAGRDSAHPAISMTKEPSRIGAGAFPSSCRSSWLRISLYIRLRMKESPIFTQIKSAGHDLRAAAEGSVHANGKT